MRGLGALSIVLFTIVNSPSLAAQQQVAGLGATYQTTLGDVAASSLSELLKARSDLRDPTIVTFEPETGTIDVEIFASPSYGSKTDQARTLLGKYWEFIRAAHIPYVKRRYDLALTAGSYRLMYYDAKAPNAPALILQYVNGQYLIP